MGYGNSAEWYSRNPTRCFPSYLSKYTAVQPCVYFGCTPCGVFDAVGLVAGRPVSRLTRNQSSGILGALAGLSNTWNLWLLQRFDNITIDCIIVNEGKVDRNWRIIGVPISILSNA